MSKQIVTELVPSMNKKDQKLQSTCMNTKSHNTSKRHDIVKLYISNAFPKITSKVYLKRIIFNIDLNCEVYHIAIYSVEGSQVKNFSLHCETY